MLDSWQVTFAIDDLEYIPNDFTILNVNFYKISKSNCDDLPLCEERDILRKTILGLCSQRIHYTKLERRVVTTCPPWATTNTFKSQIHYLLSNGYITRITRGIYQITPKGKKYLALLTS